MESLSVRKFESGAQYGVPVGYVHILVVRDTVYHIKKNIFKTGSLDYAIVNFKTKEGKNPSEGFLFLMTMWLLLKIALSYVS